MVDVPDGGGCGAPDGDVAFAVAVVIVLDGDVTADAVLHLQIAAVAALSDVPVAVRWSPNGVVGFAIAVVIGNDGFVAGRSVGKLRITTIRAV